MDLKACFQVMLVETSMVGRATKDGVMLQVQVIQITSIREESIEIRIKLIQELQMGLIIYLRQSKINSLKVLIKIE